MAEEPEEEDIRICQNCSEEDGYGNYHLRDEYDLNKCKDCKLTICDDCGSFDEFDWDDPEIDHRDMFVCYNCRNIRQGSG